MGAPGNTRATRRRRNNKRRLAAIVGLVGIVLLLGLVYLLTDDQDTPEPAAPAIISATTTPSAPPSRPSSLRIERTDTTVRLAGLVKTTSEHDALVVAATNSGFEVDDAITVSDDVTDSDPRLLAVLLPTLLDGTGDGQLSLDDGTVTITGEALDPVEAEAIKAAIADAAAAGLTVDDQTTIRVLPESVQITALQEEIDQIFELARTIDGQYPNFEESLDDLSDGAITTLDRVTVAMRRYPLPAADIVGHTDSVGSDADNLALSEARAAVVMEYLIGAGVEAERLEAIGMGEREPIATNDSDDGRAENRRVDFLIKKRES